MSATHLVLIPSYNTGPRLTSTVQEALQQWAPVWVVIDGSTDHSEQTLLTLARQEPHLRVIIRPKNGGKGAAIITGINEALASGFTHVLTMDADGQHSSAHINEFMGISLQNPKAMILGVPMFGPDVPLARFYGRKLSIGLAHVETFCMGIGDPLFGFRVYPARALQEMFKTTSGGRGFDFDPEAAVRMFWAGVPAINASAPCRYFSRSQGGVSHFHYLRDNLKLAWLHVRLIAQLLIWRWPSVLRVRQARRMAAAAPSQPAAGLLS